MLGIPDQIHACLFDLDGVRTKTAKVHAAAWKEMFGFVVGVDRLRQAGALRAHSADIVVSDLAELLDTP